MPISNTYEYFRISPRTSYDIEQSIAIYITESNISNTIISIWHSDRSIKISTPFSHQHATKILIPISYQIKDTIFI